MIKILRVKDFLLFDKATLEFDNGFNVITGETGAGKSLIIDALNLLISPRVDWDTLTKNSTIEAVIEPDGEILEILEDLGVELENDGVIIRKGFDVKNKKTKSYINDTLVSSRKIGEILQPKIFIGKQFSHMEILDEKYQTSVFDKAVGIKIDEYLKFYTDYKKKITDYERIKLEYEGLKSKEEFIRFQIKELEGIDFSIGEGDLLKRKRELEDRVKEQEWAKVFGDVYEDIYEKISRILKTSPDKFKPIFEEILERLNDIKSYLEFPEEDLISEIDEINSKLFTINRLKLKYGVDFEGLKGIRDELLQKLERLKVLEGELENLGVEIERVEKILRVEAEKLNEERVKKKKNFERDVESLLKELGFDYVKCEVAFKDGEFWERGNKVVNILISTIPDITPSHISNLSGGEISRVALVLSYLGGSNYKTLIFDEIDIGVSPKVALKIGKMLRNISEKTQVIAITHQPFTAIFGHKHFVVEKPKPDRAICTEVRGEKRIKELARMMGVKDEGVVLEVLNTYGIHP
ncbi:MAG: AAA family ATPase [candidate division WOR-3 bacterium]